MEAKTTTPFCGLVLTPTRELAVQIAEVFEALGAGISLKTVVLVGGITINQQRLALLKQPHIIVATPGRLLDHLTNTEGFSLQTLKYLVLDDADRLLSKDYEKQLDEILKVIPLQRQTYLFSATMTKKVMKLHQRACLRNPVKVESGCKYATADTLKQEFLYIRSQHKSKRLGAFNKFKAGECNILIATDVATRGLDIPSVDMVINYDIPSNTQDYIHRVGRTARDGRSGVAISLVRKYEIERFIQIENLIGMKLPKHPTEMEKVLALLERVTEAKKISHTKMKESGRKRSRKVSGDEEKEDNQRYLDKQCERMLGLNLNSNSV